MPSNVRGSMNDSNPIWPPLKVFSCVERAGESRPRQGLVAGINASTGDRDHVFQVERSVYPPISSKRDPLLLAERQSCVGIGQKEIGLEAGVDRAGEQVLLTDDFRVFLCRTGVGSGHKVSKVGRSRARSAGSVLVSGGRVVIAVLADPDKPSAESKVIREITSDMSLRNPPDRPPSRSSPNSTVALGSTGETRRRWPM